MCHISEHYQKYKNIKNFMDCSIITSEYLCKFEHNYLIGLKVI